MSDIAVIYASHYGFTETYARWIAEEVAGDLLEARKVRPEDLDRYGTVIYGGGLYAGGVNGIGLITKQFGRLRGKRLFLFTVGAADVTDPENVASIRKSLTKVLTPPMLETISVYHLRGGLNYSRMTLLHKSMMAMLRQSLLKKPENELGSDGRALLETYGQDVSFLDRASIAPLVAEVMRPREDTLAE